MIFAFDTASTLISIHRIAFNSSYYFDNKLLYQNSFDLIPKNKEINLFTGKNLLNVYLLCLSCLGIYV